jgi:hypothetical protein
MILRERSLGSMHQLEKLPVYSEARDCHHGVRPARMNGQR